jgi:hypothetical protein
MKKSGQWRRMEGAKPSIVLTLTDEAESFCSDSGIAEAVPKSD